MRTSSQRLVNLIQESPSHLEEYDMANIVVVRESRFTYKEVLLNSTSGRAYEHSADRIMENIGEISYDYPEYNIEFYRSGEIVDLLKCTANEIPFHIFGSRGIERGSNVELFVERFIGRKGEVSQEGDTKVYKVENSCTVDKTFIKNLGSGAMRCSKVMLGTGHLKYEPRHWAIRRIVSPIITMMTGGFAQMNNLRIAQRNVDKVHFTEDLLVRPLNAEERELFKVAP